MASAGCGSVGCCSLRAPSVHLNPASRHPCTRFHAHSAFPPTHLLALLHLCLAGSVPVPGPGLPLGVQVTLTPLQSSGTQVPGMWAGDESALGYKRWVECPTTTSTPIPATGADKFEAVRRAIIKSFAGFVYGFDGDLEYNKDLGVPDLDFTYGRLMVKRSGGAKSLVYVITEVRPA